MITFIDPSALRQLLVMLLVCLSVGRLSAQPPEVFNEQQSLLTLYNKAMAEEKYEVALDYATRLCVLGEKHLRAHPAINSGLFDLKGQAHFKLNQHEETLAAYEKALAYLESARNPDQKKLLATIKAVAQAQWNVKKYALAAKSYERVLKHHRSTLGDRHADSIESMSDVALCYFNVKDYTAAESYFRLALKSAQAVNAADLKIARLYNDIADCRWNLDDKSAAVSLYEQDHAFRMKHQGPLHEETLKSQFELIDAYEKTDRVNDVETLLKKVVKACENNPAAEADDVPAALLNLAEFYQEQGREAELEPLYQSVIALREKALGKDHSALAVTLHNIADIYQERGKFAAAEQYHLRGLKIREQAKDTDDADLAYSHLCAGFVLNVNSKYRAAETHLRKARALRQKQFGDDTEEVAEVTAYLAELYYNMGRNVEAVATAERAFDTYLKLKGERAIELVSPLRAIGNVHHDEGRFAEAENAFRRALSIQAEHSGEEDFSLVFILDTLANILQDQVMYKEALALRQRALAIAQTTLAADDPDMAHLLNNLASWYEDQEKWEEAEKLYRQALAVWEKPGEEVHPNVSYGLHNVASCESHLGQLAEAEAKHRRALELREKNLGAEHAQTALSRWSLAECLIKRQQTKEAEALLDRAITTLSRTRVNPPTLFRCYEARGVLSWKAQRKAEALADMHHAMDLAEQLRGHSGGAEQERAQHFSRYAGVFEKVVAWQAEQGGDPSEAFAAIERSRARSLLDEMNLSGADIIAGNSVQDREKKAQREAELKEQIAQIEQRLAAATTAEQSEQINAELDLARSRLYDHFRDQRTSSDVYRKLLAVGGDNLRVSQLQRRLTEVQGHLLIYFLGADAGYLLSVRPHDAKLHLLTFSAADAKTLGTEPGAVTNAVMRKLLMQEKGEGIVQLLSNPKQTPPIDKLHALWRTLVPEEVRADVLSGKTKRLLIVPDGALTLLPFETLVVTSGAVPTYLLHAGPPISYAPSATVLFNLYERSAATHYADSPIVTLGDPAYAPPAKEQAGQLAMSMNSSSRYGRSGGRLTPLPHTGIEANWVFDVFKRSGTSVDRLLKSEATEAKLREHLGQRKIVHLACHGLIDQTFGNFFGALALTPGTDAAINPSNDGFLTLAEIYSLDLRDCELAILSACETNYGPQQSGEGTWALSRGFLVAGSRRVIASNWLVDDQAAASLVSYYCGGLAKATPNEQTDYAASLQASKRWLSQQPKWQHPYYWAALVLVGPE